jgi:hypothetical protein
MINFSYRLCVLTKRNRTSAQPFLSIEIQSYPAQGKHQRAYLHAGILAILRKLFRVSARKSRYVFVTYKHIHRPLTVRRG